MVYKLKANKTKKENLIKDFPSFTVLKNTPLMGCGFYVDFKVGFVLPFYIITLIL